MLAKTTLLLTGVLLTSLLHAQTTEKGNVQPASFQVQLVQTKTGQHWKCISIIHRKRTCTFGFISPIWRSLSILRSAASSLISGIFSLMCRMDDTVCKSPIEKKSFKKSLRSTRSCEGTFPCIEQKLHDLFRVTSSDPFLFNPEEIIFF